ncbi:hypothetical protein HR060_07775 [Catenovulum sp. SM1970]|uniref:reprolysin-like metallopeptidase n=1 Tax=Marinifaba aquimaris TaxID=2741323 RepID=UPI001574E26B|nr:zinc-dependent metalloprotease family protein [Marinifaba aquimaris]NTS76767.1 hypothetical protein [Marinifaba aquimaris]
MSSDKNKSNWSKPLLYLLAPLLSVYSTLSVATEKLDYVLSDKGQPRAQIASVPEDSTEIAELDVLFVYADPLEQEHGNLIAPRVDNLINFSNQVYADSQVHIRLNNVGVRKLNYPETSSTPFQTILEDLNTAAHWSLVDAYRAKGILGADMLVYLRGDVTGTDSDIAGYAYLNSDVASSADSMVSIVMLGTGNNDTLAHELGHNLGLAHSRLQGDIGATFHFALGHIEPNVFNTVMAYQQDNERQALVFSNPNLDCFGLPCGIDRNDTEHGADAAYALNQVRFEAQDLVAPRTLDNVTSKIVDTNLKTCIETQLTALNAQSVAPVVSLSCPNLGISDLTGLGQFVNLTALNLSSNAITDIGELATLTQLTTLNLNNNNVSSIAAAQGLTLLTNLDLVNNPVACLSEDENLAYQDINTSCFNDNLISQAIFADPVLTQCVSEATDSNNQALTYLHEVTALNCRSNGTMTDLSGVEQLTNLVEFSFNVVRQIDYSPLSTMNQMAELSISQTGTRRETIMADLNFLTDLTELQSLSLDVNGSYSDLSPLANLAKLDLLDLDSSALINHTQLQFLPSLRNLTIYHPLTDISWLSSMSQLSSLYLYDSRNSFTSLSALSAVTQLQFLGIEAPITSLVPLANHSALSRLYLYNTEIDSVVSLASVTNLDQIILFGNGQLTELTGLANLNLVRLDLQFNNLSCMNNDIFMQFLTVADIDESCFSELATETITDLATDTESDTATDTSTETDTTITIETETETVTDTVTMTETDTEDVTETETETQTQVTATPTTPAAASSSGGGSIVFIVGFVSALLFIRRKRTEKY